MTRDKKRRQPPVERIRAVAKRMMSGDKDALDDLETAEERAKALGIVERKLEERIRFTRRQRERLEARGEKQKAAEGERLQAQAERLLGDVRHIREIQEFVADDDVG
jgi:hypothetical protein